LARFRLAKLFDQKDRGEPPSTKVTESGPAAVSPTAPAFEDIFREHAPYLWRALVSLGVRESDAEDLCQEAMLVVHRRLSDFDGRALKSWLYGICLRVASDYRRSARVRREQVTDAVPDAPTAATQPEEVDARRAEMRLLSALDELDDDKRAAFVLFEVEGLTLREVADAMDCPIQTAFSRLQAARGKVRQAFGDQPQARSA
jgi:RNA polymerase sigma-70 factor (ECF subfamily)